MTAAWLVPALVYVVILGALGVTSKLALRTLTWHDLLLWTGVAYVCFAIVMLALGQASFRVDGNIGWALISAVIAPTALILLYFALGHGEASQIFPVTAAYPAVTVALAAIVLSEPLTVAKVGGMALVLSGVVLISISK
jgi:bacterial/archaeal transporter family protein